MKKLSYNVVYLMRNREYETADTKSQTYELEQFVDNYLLITIMVIQLDFYKYLNVYKVIE